MIDELTTKIGTESDLKKMVHANILTGEMVQPVHKILLLR